MGCQEGKEIHAPRVQKSGSEMPADRWQTCSLPKNTGRQLHLSKQRKTWAHTQALPHFHLSDLNRSHSSPLQTPNPAARERFQTHPGAPAISSSVQSCRTHGLTAHDFLIFHQFPGFKQLNLPSRWMQIWLCFKWKQNEKFKPVPCPWVDIQLAGWPWPTPDSSELHCPHL